VNLLPNAQSRLRGVAANFDGRNAVLSKDIEVMAVGVGGSWVMYKIEISGLNCVRLYTQSQCAVPPLVAIA
jgi:hypothetical protein